MKTPQSTALNEARDRFIEARRVLQLSRALYLKNKHRSLPNRGRYASALRIAQDAFESAKQNLQDALQRHRKAHHIRELREVLRRELANTRAQSRDQSTANLIDLQKRQREYLAKIHFTRELESQAMADQRRANGKK